MIPDDMEKPVNEFDLGKEIASYADSPDRRQFPLAELSELVSELSVELRLEFQAAIRGRLDSHPEIPERVKEEVIAEAYDLPTVEIFDTPRVMKARLEDLKVAEDVIGRIKDDELIMTIQLPDPMRVRFDEFEEVHEFPGLWFDLYGSGIASLWDTANGFAAAHGLALERINVIGEHDFDKGGYYYIWHLAPKGREPLFPDPEPGPDEEYD